MTTNYTGVIVIRKHLENSVVLSFFGRSSESSEEEVFLRNSPQKLEIEGAPLAGHFRCSVNCLISRPKRRRQEVG